MNQKLYDLIEVNPVIAAVRDMEGLDARCKRDRVKVVFILFGDIYNISAIVGQTKEPGKVVIVYIDLIAGLSSKEVAVGFTRNSTNADGVISTEPALIERVRGLSLHAMLRVFILDSMTFGNIEKQVSVARPGIIETLPGLMPKAMRRMCRLVKVSVIAGGFISGKEDVMAALLTGAASVSATNREVWLMWIPKLKSALLGKENRFMYK